MGHSERCGPLFPLGRGGAHSLALPQFYPDASANPNPDFDTHVYLHNEPYFDQHCHALASASFRNRAFAHRDRHGNKTANGNAHAAAAHCDKNGIAHGHAPARR